MKSILFIVGSLRKKSFNLELARMAEKELEGKAQVSYLDYSKVPFVNQDLEFPALPAVTALRQAVEHADGVWLFTPEYNYSYPGHVKNLLDWLSRPVDPNHRSAPTVLAGKKFAIAGAGGKNKTATCRKLLTALRTGLGAQVMTQCQTGIGLNIEAWTENRMILTDEQKAQLRQQAEAFLQFI